MTSFVEILLELKELKILYFPLIETQKTHLVSLSYVSSEILILSAILNSSKTFFRPSAEWPVWLCWDLKG